MGFFSNLFKKESKAVEITKEQIAELFTGLILQSHYEILNPKEKFSIHCPDYDKQSGISLRLIGVKIAIIESCSMLKNSHPFCFVDVIPLMFQLILNEIVSSDNDDETIKKEKFKCVKKFIENIKDDFSSCVIRLYSAEDFLQVASLIYDGKDFTRYLMLDTDDFFCRTFISNDLMSFKPVIEKFISEIKCFTVSENEYMYQLGK